MDRMEGFVVVETEVLEVAEAEVRGGEEVMVRLVRSASHPVGRGEKLLYPLPHVCSSCEELRTSILLRLPQVLFTSMISVCVFCSILGLPIVSLLSRVLLD